MNENMSTEYLDLSLDQNDLDLEDSPGQKALGSIPKGHTVYPGILEQDA